MEITLYETDEFIDGINAETGEEVHRRIWVDDDGNEFVSREMLDGTHYCIPAAIIRALLA